MAAKNNLTDEYYSVAQQIIKSVGKVFADGFSKTKTVEIKSSMYDLVTEYDKRVEKLLIEEIKKHFPNHKFIGEETLNTEDLSDAPTWIIDPIDGTTNFVHADEHCVISVALAVNKQLEIGIVYSPVKDQMFCAQRGKGAWLNGKRINVSSVTDVNQALVGFEISMAVSVNIKEKLLKRLEAIVSNAQGIRTIGTCALSLCYVALGAWDAYQVDHLYSWDYSAGALIVQEAGGIVLSTDGSPFEIMKQRVLAVCSKELAEKLVDLFKKTDASL